MAIDLGQARRESRITREQVLAMALKAKAARRFRLEQSRAGESRLLTAIAVNRAQARYGGQIVELVTMAEWLIATAETLPRCERASCQARHGQPCRNVHGIRAPHKNRLGKAEPPRIALEEYLRCETCGAWPGKPCHTESGAPRPRVHKERPMLAPPAEAAP